MTNEQTPDSTAKAARPHVTVVMFERGVRVETIRVELGMGSNTVRRALNPTQCGVTAFGAVMLIRQCIEKHLRDHGWQGTAAELWAEHDEVAIAQERREGEGLAA